MPIQYILKYEDENGNPSIFISPDMTLINKVAEAAGKVTKLTLERAGTKITVDYSTGRIMKNGDIIVDPLYRWVNFKRHFVKLGTEPQSNSHNFLCCVGWQVTLNGENFKKIIGVDEKGNVRVIE